MKKFLLLLSCCFATWCSVQAGVKSSASSSEMFSAESRTMMLNSVMAAPSNASGSISSLSYYPSTSKITFRYKTSNASSVSLNFLSIQKGGVINPQPYSLTPSNGYYTYKTIDIDPNWTESDFRLYLYVNGSVAGEVSNGKVYPCFEAKVTITALGSISSVPVNGNNVSVNYTMQHGSIYSSLRVFKKNANGTETLVKRINLSDPNSKINTSNTNINTYRNVSFGTLEGGEYICKLYSNEKILATKDFTVGNWYSGVKITPMGSGSLKLDFTLKDTGVDVAFRVTAASLTNYTGETNTYYYGRCDQHEGTYTVPVPRYTGQVIYAVELLVNGQSVNGASIQVYNR